MDVTVTQIPPPKKRLIISVFLSPSFSARTNISTDASHDLKNIDRSRQTAVNRWIDVKHTPSEASEPYSSFRHIRDYFDCLLQILSQQLFARINTDVGSVIISSTALSSRVPSVS